VASSEQLNIEVRLRDFASAQFGKLNSVVKGFGSGALGAFKSVTGAVFSLKGALAGLGVAFTIKGLTDLVKATANEADSLRDLSKQLGTSTEFLSELQFAGGQAGVGIGELEVGIRTLGKNLGEIAATGGGPALKALKQLDQQTQDLLTSNASLSDKFLATARAIRALPESEKLFVTSKLFGRGGGSFLQLFAEDLDAATKKARELGLSISGPAAAGADKFNDAIGELSGALKGFRNQVILPLLPELSRIFTSATESLVANRPAILRFFADIIQSAGEFGTIVGKTFQGISEVVNFAQTALTDFNFNSATNEVNKIQRRIEALNDQLTKLSDQGVDIFGDPTRSAAIFAERRKEQAALAAAQKELNDITQRSADLSTAQAKQAELASGGVERGAKAAADAIRGVADAQEEVLKNNKALALSNELVPLLPTEKLTEAYEDQDKVLKDLVRSVKDRVAATVDGGRALVVSGLAELKALDDRRLAVEELNAAEDKAFRKRLRQSQELIEAQQEFAGRRNEQLRLAADEEAQLQRAQNAVSGLTGAFSKLREDSKEFGFAARDAVLGVSDALATNLSDGLIAVAEGTKSAKEAFRDFAKSTLNDIQRIIIQTLILKAVQSSLGSIGGLAFAQGGVIAGSPERVPGLARGDVIAPPGGTFQIAEAGRPEAVLPLMRNSRGDLGVQTVGARGGNSQVVNVTVNYNGTIGEKALFARNVEQIRQAVAQGVRESSNYREQLRAA
jgi:hypothetical protein